MGTFDTSILTSHCCSLPGAKFLVSKVTLVYMEDVSPLRSTLKQCSLQAPPTVCNWPQPGPSCPNSTIPATTTDSFGHPQRRAKKRNPSPVHRPHRPVHFGLHSRRLERFDLDVGQVLDIHLTCLVLVIARSASKKAVPQGLLAQQSRRNTESNVRKSTGWDDC